MRLAWISLKHGEVAEACAWAIVALAPRSVKRCLIPGLLGELTATDERLRTREVPRITVDEILRALK